MKIGTGGRMMIPALFTAALWGQASLTTNWVNGLQMAVVLHGATGMAVTDGSPAEPGETLILQGAGFSGGAQILVGGASVDTTVIDDGDAQFVLPASAGWRACGSPTKYTCLNPDP